jgi:hypothetical protein
MEREERRGCRGRGYDATPDCLSVYIRAGRSGGIVYMGLTRKKEKEAYMELELEMDIA